MLEELSNIRKVMPSFRSFRSLSPRARSEFRTGILFLSPWIFGFLVFTLLPMLATFFFSFLNLNITDGILSKPDFVGLDNYKQLFKDPQVWSTGADSRFPVGHHQVRIDRITSRHFRSPWAWQS